METNLLVAIQNAIRDGLNMSPWSQTSGGVNWTGNTLETYIKDLFCNSIDIGYKDHKEREYSEYLSYQGGKNNPPDFMVRGGDAVEVKKTGNKSKLALNSSYPKDRLYSNSPMITDECRAAEPGWETKDHLYCIGTTAKSGGLEDLWLVYGDCIAAREETYTRIKDTISNSLEELEGVNLSPTSEIGRLNELDILGITDLRIRPMWQLTHPSKVFEYLPHVGNGDLPALYSVMRKAKYEEFPQEQRKILENLNDSNLTFCHTDIKDPNEIGKMIEAVVVTYRF